MTGAARPGRVRAVPFDCLSKVPLAELAAVVLVSAAAPDAASASGAATGPDGGPTGRPRVPGILRTGAAALGLSLDGEVRLGPRGRPYLHRVPGLAGDVDPQDRQAATGAGTERVPDPGPNGAGPIDFNISHSGELVGVALGRTDTLGRTGTLGLDLQQRAGPGWERVAARWLHRDEWDRLRRLPPTEAADRFTRYWAIREARCKATGVGLAGFRSPSPIGGLGLPGAAGGCCDAVWWRELPAPQGYAAALAYQGPRGAEWLGRDVVTGRL